MEDIYIKIIWDSKFIVANFIAKGLKTSFVKMWSLVMKGFVKLSVLLSRTPNMSVTSQMKEQVIKKSEPQYKLCCLTYIRITLDWVITKQRINLDFINYISAECHSKMPVNWVQTATLDIKCLCHNNNKVKKQ